MVRKKLRMILSERRNKMNKSAKELLDKCIKLEMDKKLPLFKGIYIIQQRELHDSGYRMMYVI